MKVRLSERDIKLIVFLSRYNKIKGKECKRIYDSTDYYRKRLKVLEKARYIRRENRYYIKLDIEGRKLLNLCGYTIYGMCRNKDYQNRIDDIIKIATISLNSSIEFTPSWELKERNVFTNFGRKYIGIMKYENRKHIVYYIANRNKLLYTKQVLTDICINIQYNNVIIFLEDFKSINKYIKDFLATDKRIQIIKPTEENFKVMKILEEIGTYDIISEIYKGKEILLPNWNIADYVTSDRIYIFSMLFIDIDKLHKINIYYNKNEEHNKNLNIITLKGNKNKIEEILKTKVNIIEIEVERIYELYKMQNMDIFFTEND